MVRYHLMCKNSLLLLKCKFLLRVGEKNCFSYWIFHVFISFHFIFIYLHCYISISSLNGVTLWKLIFPFLVPHWILVVTFVSTVISPWWFAEYTVLTDKYFSPTLIVVVLLQSVWRRLFSNVPVSYERDIKDCVIFKCCAAPSEAFNISWYVLRIAHAALVMNVSSQQVHLNWPCLFQGCASSFDGCALLMAIALRILNLSWLTFLCYAIALHVCQISFEHRPGVVWK